MAENAREHAATADGGGRRRAAADGSGVARNEARGHASARSLHQSDARATARLTRAARAARMRRRRHAVQRGGAAWRRNSGEPSSVTRCAGTSTRGMGGLLTSLRDSGVAPRRRRGGDGGRLLQRRRTGRLGSSGGP
jgi:hypothetical protein